MFKIYFEMKNKVLRVGLLLLTALIISAGTIQSKSIRVLVVTGGHGYQEKQFNEMLSGMGENITCKVIPFPEAYSMFLPENRNLYDVLVFYHMWQTITEEEAGNFAECIREGKPLVVLHHSICAFDEWPEYWKIIGGKYFHKPTLLSGKEYPACTYKHDLKFMVKVVPSKHPVTKGLHDFEVTDESYYGYYVDPEVIPLLTTGEPSSTPVIGWTKKYGKAQVVTIQSGHDSLTYANPAFRKLLRQAVLFVLKKSE
jgi:uncharacterized protein